MKRVIVATIGVAATAAGLLMCGGTTGFENQPSNVAGGLDGGADGTLGDDGSLYTGEFDAEIPWVDVYLPDVHTVPVEGGLPDCPPYIPVHILSTDAGTIVTRLASPTGYATTEVPGVWTDDAGDEGFAPDGSACATYAWLGGDPGAVAQHLSKDGMLTHFPSITNMGYAPYLPPCSWAMDAGKAVAGPGTQAERYDNCITLYECMMRTKCYVVDPAGCFCGYLDPATGDTSFCLTNPHGQCMTEELAALEVAGSPAAVASQVLSGYNTTDPTSPGWAGAYLNELMYQLDHSGWNPFDASAQTATPGDD